MAVDPISWSSGLQGPSCGTLPVPLCQEVIEPMGPGIVAGRPQKRFKGGTSMKLHRVAILSSVLLCFSTAPAFARTLVVDDDAAECPKAEYNTIQQAVAVSQPGDKILVCPGLYRGTVVVGTPDLRIEGRGAPEEVVLQGTGAADTSLGFVLLNTTGVVLQGFTVERFGRAQIRIQGGSGNTVRKNITRNAVVNDGIQVTSSSDNVVEQNTSYGNPEDGIFVGPITGIPVEPMADNIIRHNETLENRFGIHLSGTAPGNVVFGNRSHDNRQRGIVNANLSHGNVIEYNHAFANGLTPIPGVGGVGTGINVVNSNLVTVKNNKAEGNGTNGITLTVTANNVAANNVVTGNQSDDNGLAGVLFNGASSNLVEKNELFRNGQDGVRITNNAASNTIQSNHIQRSRRDGVRAEVASRDNTIERNIIAESAEHDAHDDSVGAGTGGSANFWIDNHCETENRPGLCDH
jgi:parallel beta-helix repeat protein